MILVRTFFVVLLFWAESSYAAEGHGASVTQLLFPFINFLIFLYLLKRFGVPLARDYVRARRERLLTAIEEAEQAKRSAEAAHLHYRDLLSKSAGEARLLSETLRADGEKQKARIVSEAEETARQITADADFQARQEIKMAQQRLRAELAAVGRGEAEKLIRRHFTPGDQGRLVEEFLSQLGASR